jgi:hypothetical protein
MEDSATFVSHVVLGVGGHQFAFQVAASGVATFQRDRPWVIIPKEFTVWLLS